MPKIFKKPVSLTELFYDLVFVYAVSQITEIFEPLHHHELSWMRVLLYVGVFMSFIGSWNIQTVYFNRFGEHTFKDIILMSTVQMPILLFMAQYANPQSTEDLQLFSIGLALLSVVHIGQYAWIMYTAKDSAAVSTARTFVAMLSARLVGIIIGIIVGGAAGFGIVVTSVVFFLFYPLLFRRRAMAVPVNVPHLIERLQLLTIITFGELIVGEARYFNVATISVLSYVGFLIIVHFFMFYIVEFDHNIDEGMDGGKATSMIYFHYLIWFGINLITVGYDFIDMERSTAANMVINVGALLFYVGVLCHIPFHRASHRMPARIFIPMVAVIAGGLAATAFVMNNVTGYSAISFVYTFAVMVLFMYFTISRRRAAGELDGESEAEREVEGEVEGEVEPDAVSDDARGETFSERVAQRTETEGVDITAV